jgi:CRP-like cAMP-binding protein
MQFKGAILVLLVLMSIATTVAPRKLLTNEFALSNTLDFATEHQRILAELEEVHQLRERMLQQGEMQSGMTWCTFVQCKACEADIESICEAVTSSQIVWLVMTQ